MKFLGEDDYFIKKDKDINIIEVREKTNGIVNQDIAFTLVEDGLKYDILRKSRGSETKIITLSNKATALFYLGTKVKVSRLSIRYPKPKISYISSKDNAREVLSDFLEDGLYEIEKRKKDAICLFEENNIYVVGYCDLVTTALTSMSVGGVKGAVIGVAASVFADMLMDPTVEYIKKHKVEEKRADWEDDGIHKGWKKFLDLKLKYTIENYKVSY
ncbi:hypothetical protein [Listeria seeligeri]|uniref:hypothetical protein n=1 Tax=Listeria seeligeri TaxID=1640 RepID=UPI0016266830|nr:hypothetical protein [Listeria seeligeri]MBC1586144.1 hypothetical protein [Listeria seeligeri]MBF2377190.1 hypothetical protein [Listeria seeligeri]